MEVFVWYGRFCLEKKTLKFMSGLRNTKKLKILLLVGLHKSKVLKASYPKHQTTFRFIENQIRQYRTHSRGWLDSYIKAGKKNVWTLLTSNRSWRLFWYFSKASILSYFHYIYISTDDKHHRSSQKADRKSPCGTHPDSIFSSFISHNGSCCLTDWSGSKSGLRLELCGMNVKVGFERMKV